MQRGDIGIYVAVFLVLVVGIGGGFWYFFYREGIDPLKLKAQPTVSPDGAGDTGRFTTTRSPEDINDDGVIDTVDVQMVQGSLGCKQGADCWDDVIGKTLSGDNPIYVSDFDLNKDGEVSDLDVQMVNAKAIDGSGP